MPMTPLLPVDQMTWALLDTDTGELEMFSTRPNTPAMGGDRSNWPSNFKLYEGYINGGDSVIIEEQHA